MIYLCYQKQQNPNNMKLQTSFQKFRPLKQGGKNQLQEIVISCNVSSPREAYDLSHEHFAIDLYIDRKFVGDLSYILAEVNDEAFRDIIDSIDWDYEWHVANDNSLDDDQQRTDWQDR
jgi:hypothetical protein